MLAQSLSVMLWLCVVLLTSEGMLPPNNCDGTGICTSESLRPPVLGGLSGESGQSGIPGGRRRDPDRIIRRAFDRFIRRNPGLFSTSDGAGAEPRIDIGGDFNSCYPERCWTGDPFSIVIPRDGEVRVVQIRGVYEQTLRWCFCGSAICSGITLESPPWNGVCRPDKRNRKLLVYIPRLRGLRLRWVTIEGGCGCAPLELLPPGK